MSWKLKRTKQCAKCPWKKSTNPHDIPNGYDVEKHKALARTIAAGDGSDWQNAVAEKIHIMACHEEHQSHCIGWLMHQLGPGNNIPLRIHVRDCENIGKVRLDGEQHERFIDTLPNLGAPRKRG